MNCVHTRRLLLRRMSGAAAVSRHSFTLSSTRVLYVRCAMQLLAMRAELVRCSLVRGQHGTRLLAVSGLCSHALHTPLTTTAATAGSALTQRDTASSAARAIKWPLYSLNRAENKLSWLQWAVQLSLQCCCCCCCAACSGHNRMQTKCHTHYSNAAKGRNRI